MAVNTYYSPENQSFLNVQYALIDALEVYFAVKYFKGDKTRVLYCSDDFALQKRSSTQDHNHLNIPFCNFKRINISNDLNRNWFSMSAFTKGVGANNGGVFIPSLNKKLKLVPVNLSFEMTFYFNQDLDYVYASNLIMEDWLAETKLEYHVIVKHSPAPDADQTDLKLIAIMNQTPDLNPQYQEREWLEESHVWAPKHDFTIQTFFLMGTDLIYPTEEAILNLALQEKLDLEDPTTAYAKLTETVSI